MEEKVTVYELLGTVIVAIDSYSPTIGGLAEAKTPRIGLTLNLQSHTRYRLPLLLKLQMNIALAV